MNTTVLEVNVALKTESAWPIRNAASDAAAMIGDVYDPSSAAQRLGCVQEPSDVHHQRVLTHGRGVAR
jgi:hypothetical protein